MKHLCLILLLLLLCGGGCDNNVPPSVPSGSQSASQEAVETPTFEIIDVVEKSPGLKSFTSTPTLFVDDHQSAGVNFIYQSGLTGQNLMVEAIGGGGGWLDYDSDGDWDLYCVQGGDPRSKFQEQRPPNQWFRNLGNGTFDEVPEVMDAKSFGYGQGLAVGDFNNDGFDDLFVTNTDQNLLFLNQGDGTYEEVLDFPDREQKLWSTSCAWSDWDKDGDLDLFVCQYLDYNADDPKICLGADGKPGTCAPNDIDPVTNSAYLNLGDGTFREVSAEIGLQGEGSKSLGVVIADLNLDEWPDLFVCNDTTANFLFLNRQDGTFEEVGTQMGCALSGLGKYQASMGVAQGDYDGDGFIDLYCTHFSTDHNTLYRNLGENGFVDTTASTGMMAPTMPWLGFGTVMSDFNRNGKQELFIANGHIENRSDENIPFEMPAQIFEYSGATWVEQTAKAGNYFERYVIGRAVSTSDYDDDGDLDLLVVHQNEPTALLRNETTTGHFMKLRFRGTISNRRGVGVRVRLQQGESAYVQELVGGSSYCSCHAAELLFGLTDEIAPCQLEVIWPSGMRQTLSEVTPDQSLVITEPES